MLLAASSAPSPLYPVYQAEFGFSALTLTAVFAVYVLALLTSLLTLGRLSDFLGRRPVLAVALLVEAAAMGVFLDAHGVGALFAARIVQGLATGAALGVLGAYQLDFDAQPAVILAAGRSSTSCCSDRWSGPGCRRDGSADRVRAASDASRVRDLHRRLRCSRDGDLRVARDRRAEAGCADVR